MKLWQKIDFVKDGKRIKKYKFCGITLLRKEKCPQSRKIDLFGCKLYQSIDMGNIVQNMVRAVPPTPIKKVEFTKYTLLRKPSSKLTLPKFDEIMVSIVIPVYNNYKYTKLCLQSIIENTQDVSYEVILADDNSTDETQDIKKVVKNLKVSRNRTNLRFLKNCNKAAQQAVGKYVLFLNNDTQVQKGWLSALVDMMEQHSDIGLVGSKLIYPDGKLQEAGGIIFSDARGSNYGKNDDPDNLWYNYVKEVDYISGAAIMLKREMWNELGGFDEEFAPAYYEDTDLAFRIRYQKGLKVVYVPQSLVVHFEGKSNGTDLSSGQKQYQMINREKFYQKWKKELHQYHVNLAAGVSQSRERSQNKKNILVIDWKVLSFSEDTGSRTTWQYMQFFRDMGLNVKLYPHYKNFDEKYLRAHLEEGFEVIMQDFMSYIQQYGKYFDYVYVNRPNIACFYLDALRRYTNAKIVYQCHDLHYLRQYRVRLLNGDPDAEQMFAREKQFEYDIFRKTDVACTFSYDEVATMLREDAYVNAQQIPLYILDSEKMDIYDYQPQKRKDIMFVAGFQHKPNVDAAVWFVENIFPKIKKKIPDIKIYLVGSKPTQAVRDLACDDVIVTGFVTDEELEEYYTKIKLVVVPLRSGAGVKGKIIESIYHKVPVITTDIGIEGINNEEKIIDVKNEPKEFADCVIKRYNDDAFLSKQSAKFQQWIHKHFSKDAVCESLKDYIDFPKQ